MARGWFRPITPSRDEPVKLDTSVAHIARTQNYWRGGKDNFAADRAAAEHAMAAYPDLVSSVRANQAFLARSVRYLAGETGVRQFLDIGTGFRPRAACTRSPRPRAGQPGRVRGHRPHSPAHARALLASSAPGSTSYVHADVRDASRLLEQAASALDFSAALAVILVSVLHMIPRPRRSERDREPADGRCAPGQLPGPDRRRSRILSLRRWRKWPAGVNQRVAQADSPARLCPRWRVSSPDLELVPPGVVRVPEWRPHVAAGGRRSFDPSGAAPPRSGAAGRPGCGGPAAIRAPSSPCIP